MFCQLHRKEGLAIPSVSVGTCVFYLKHLYAALHSVHIPVIITSPLVTVSRQIEGGSKQVRNITVM